MCYPNMALFDGNTAYISKNLLELYIVLSAKKRVEKFNRDTRTMT